MAPPALRLRPVGSDPFVSDQVNGVGPPLADNVWLYATPANPPGSDVVSTWTLDCATPDRASRHPMVSAALTFAPPMRRQARQRSRRNPVFVKRSRACQR